MNDLTNCGIEPLWQDGEFALARVAKPNGLPSCLLVAPVLDRPAPASVAKLENAFALRDELDASWAARPMELVGFRGRLALAIEDPGGEFLDKKIDGPLAVPDFLRLAISIAASLGGLHRNGLVHKDVKPANLIVNAGTGQSWLTGFSLTTRLPRHRQPPDPPEIIAGTLAYMAPEQTGRMNRSIDSRSDLYSLGVTFYEMLTGSLPFTASDPMEWVHCHIARQTPVPGERVNGIPEVVSSIVMKLLAKAAEERYQTTAGLEWDLRRCLNECQSRGRIEPFLLGAHDASDRLLIPEALYGREPEIAALLASFDRVVSGGRPELVLVSGFSGVGKSSVVNELHKPLVPPRGLFASGKFDQYKRDIPYATLAQAFQSLIRPILAKNEKELGRWRDAIREALGPNGQLMVDLVPELKLIIGEQQAVPELPPQNARGRFQLVFRRFISAFTQEHPLALFLDDLQWLDGATLDLMEDLLTHPDVKQLMLIGAYRDNEVNSAHPLMRKLHAMRQAGAILHDIVLAPLTRGDLEQLIAVSLHCERGHAGPLAELAEEKTGGNPFFAIQFLSALSEEGLLYFDQVEGRWDWDLNRIHAKGYTDNVVDLMVGKLNRLPTDTQKALQQLACLGNSADFAMLRTVYRDSSDEMHGQLWEAVRTGLILRSEDSYRFLHDRVQEAAYSLIPIECRAEMHLRIGELMVSHTLPHKLEDEIFEIVNQLNRGVALITSRREKNQLAEFNLIAGKRAKTSAAYVSALSYLVAGAALLPDDASESLPNLVFALELHRAECEFLTGEPTAADARLTTLSSRSANTIDMAIVASLRIDLYMTLGFYDRAVDVCCTFFRHLGIELSPHPTEAEARREYERTTSLLGPRAIEQLIDLPMMSEPESVAKLDVLMKVLTPAMFTDSNLLSLLTCRIINLSIEYGNTDSSCYAYVWLGVVAGPRFGNYQAGFRFGQLGYDLVKSRGLTRFEARTCVSYGVFIMPWTKNLRASQDVIRQAFVSANVVGDLTNASYSCVNLIGNLLAAGDPLAEVELEAEHGFLFAGNARFRVVIECLTTQLAFIRTLRGSTTVFNCFDGAKLDEHEYEQRVCGHSSLAIAECWYWIRKLQARFFAGDYAAAIGALENAKRLIWTSHSFIEVAEYHFYGALARAGAFDSATDDSRQGHFEALADHHRQLVIWAENCPENFENRSALVTAEIARIEGRDADAMRLYEQAIRSARGHGFIQNEGVANEAAARFYTARGSETSANAHLRNARHCYLRWGADGKVRQLDWLYPHLAAPEGPNAAALNTTIGAPVGQLDADTVARASQALSSEIVLPKLIERLMRIALEHAGAERGLLILLRGSEPLIEAEATTGHGRIDVYVRQADVTAADLPKSALQYVIRTRERVVLEDASVGKPYSDDAYWEQGKAKSVLCLPIVKQTKLIGVLYLENNLTPHVFTAGRVAVLDMLASQAAISLENARLYSELRRSEALLAEGQSISRTGTWTRNLLTDEVFWSDESYRIFGYRPGEIEPNYLFFLERVHAEDRESLEKTVDQAIKKQSDFTVEFRIILPDGTIRHVQSGARHIAKGSNEDDYYIGTNMDITERKSAELELRRSDEKLRETQAELAHVSRVTTMGELAASIAHEINQPIAGVVINANACLRWLARVKEESVELAEARETLRRIIRDGIRAGEIIARIRALFKKTESVKEPLDFNETIREIIVLAKSEMDKQQVRLRLALSSDLPHVLGDRVQLQQVLLNLILNAIDSMATVHGRTHELVIQTQRREEREILVTVRDSGIGIHPESMEDVFTAFHTTKPGGLGMGLSISRSIVENHSGRLWATGHEGPGASFHFAIPSHLAQSGLDV